MITLVLGSAGCLEKDLDNFHALGVPATTIVAVNDAGWFYTGPIDHWVSWHPKKFPEWRAQREGGGYRTWSNAGEVDGVIPDAWPDGSSGLLAVQLALRVLGATRIVVCGMPIDERPSVTGRHRWAIKESLRYRKGWTDRLEIISPHVRSMSGWTRELLGEPTEEWLE